MVIDTYTDIESSLASEGSVNTSAVLSRTANELADIAATYAAQDSWMERVRLRRDRRWYERLHHGHDYDVWVISWLPGQSTGFHDHGDSAGAFVVATGSLEEHRPGEQVKTLQTGERRAFGADYAHDVRNVSSAPAISIHVYSPPLTEMNEYELEQDRLVPRNEARADEENWGTREEVTTRRGVASVDQMLEAARSRLDRLSPTAAYEAAAREGAILVDIRPAAQRAEEGSINGALIIERNVLEWRFDPASDARLPIATDHSVQVIVFCSEGYTSSLAAASLQELGLWRATDIVGGFHSWRAAGLPVTSAAG
jgi:rhodanese-related sulfurtransferase/mannose-6-phosphate isomerase-like protein (cupin superfamily)